MDLSGLKWPLIIGLVVLVGWLGTSPGVNFMRGQYTKAVPGADAAKDVSDEAGLSRLGGYCMRTFQYAKAIDIFEESLSRYGENGKNYWYNLYRLVRCYEKVNDYQEAYNILKSLERNDAQTFDARVPNRDNLALRAEKLKEVHELAGEGT
jgi:tetratricopeptide (TPR) repeat protein